ncbi:MAG: LysM peptidoglycan-binding domain-containing protein, partial [Bacteroides sp.]
MLGVHHPVAVLEVRAGAPRIGGGVGQQGDTLSAIAARNGVSIQALLAANPQISNPDLIFAGDTI